jgi:hypothetical protein
MGKKSFKQSLMNIFTDKKLTGKSTTNESLMDKTLKNKSFTDKRLTALWTKVFCRNVFFLNEAALAFAKERELHRL